MKTCKDCAKNLVKANWPSWRRKSRHRLCYECGLARYRERYKKVAPQMRERQRRYRIMCKEETILEYGGRCVCCGEKRFEFLTIEHINQDGAEHRRKIGGSRMMHSWLKKNNYPDGYTILCFNCNAASYYYGKCPHKSLSGSVNK